MKFAFLILAHKQIDLVYRQIDMLSHPDHHFFIHLDKKSNLNIKEKYSNKKNVHFTINRIRVNWGGFNMVRATLNLIQEAMSSGNKFDYFILMSGQCFPIKPTNYIRKFFKKNNGLSFIELYPFLDEKSKAQGLDRFHFPAFFDQLSFILKDAHTIGNKTYSFKKRLSQIIFRLFEKMRYRRKLPNGLTPCYGSQWWALHNTAIDYIMKYLTQSPEVHNFFKYTWAPDELFFQTIMYNSPLSKDIKPFSLWYIDWNTNGPSKTLDSDDIDALIQSKALLARKFDLNKSLDLIHKLEHL